ncbi:hypothetical protein V6Z11_A07G241600 [Gossypium hirsutum]
MSARPRKYTKIHHIVRIRQMLQWWRNKARMSTRCILSDVPVGHMAIYVWTSCRRFVVRVFRKLLIQTEEEYEFINQGLLAILCDESVVEQVIQLISGNYK